MNTKVIVSDKYIPTLQELKALFHEVLPAQDLESYRLKGLAPNAEVVVGMSGGADSTVLGFLAALFIAPHVKKITYLFTDTGAEPESCHQTLSLFEQVTGQTITRLEPEKDLFGLIDEYNGYLPSARSRWCTRMLKIEPLQALISQKVEEGVKVFSLAGIRFDEAGREGLQLSYDMEVANAAYPFVDLEMTKAQVFEILDRSIGIPKTYAYRSRSGCYTCFFQKNQELIGMAFNDPEAFEKTAACEKLVAADQKRWQVPENFKRARRFLPPVPRFVDIRYLDSSEVAAPKAKKKAKDTGMADMFPDLELSQSNALYVAYALYVHPMMGIYGGREFTPGSYGTQFITFSTSLPGLKSALGHYYRFKMTTPDPRFNLDHLQIVITQLEFTPGTIDLNPPAPESYTWKSGTTMAQLRHLAFHAADSLEYAGLMQEKAEYKQTIATATTFAIENYADEQMERVNRQLAKRDPAKGKVVWQGLYRPVKTDKQYVQLQLLGIAPEYKPQKASTGIELDNVPLACVACSI